MALSPRIIRQRIKAVKNTKKITKAMELVAASKMRKATAAVAGTRPFSSLAWEAVHAVSGRVDAALHPLLAARKTGKTLLIIFTSDRGLCGGFNAKILKETLLSLSTDRSLVDVLAVGRRGEQAMMRAGLHITASFTNLSNNPTFTDILPIARLALDGWLDGTYSRVTVAYTDFVSALTQRPKVFTLLPLAPESATVESPPSNLSRSEYRFEPSPQQVLDLLLPRIVEIMLWQALLESSASEHSARMMSMRSASDAAGEMIDDLNLTFNQARQSGITREIAEISSGKAALE